MANTSCKFKQVKKGPIFCSWLCVMLPKKPCTSINLYTYQQIKTGKLLLFHVCMKMLPRSIMILRNLFKSVKPRGKLQVLCEPQAQGPSSFPPSSVLFYSFLKTPACKPGGGAGNCKRGALLLACILRTTENTRKLNLLPSFLPTLTLRMIGPFTNFTINRQDL